MTVSYMIRLLDVDDTFAAYFPVSVTRVLYDKNACTVRHVPC